MSIPNERAPGVIQKTIFASRWLQAPLYLGLIAVQGIYIYQFFVELFHLGQTAFASHSEDSIPAATRIMLGVLGLIDVVMISNLLIMVIIGGYETFVSRLNLGDHPDQPEWLGHVNAGVLKVKLATALIGISAVDLLRTFIEVRVPEYHLTNDMVMWQVIIHLVFVASALALAMMERIMPGGGQKH